MYVYIYIYMARDLSENEFQFNLLENTAVWDLIDATKTTKGSGHKKTLNAHMTNPNH